MIAIWCFRIIAIYRVNFVKWCFRIRVDWFDLGLLIFRIRGSNFQSGVVVLWFVVSNLKI
jgi:hypothetical protein